MPYPCWSRTFWFLKNLSIFCLLKNDRCKGNSVSVPREFRPWSSENCIYSDRGGKIPFSVPHECVIFSDEMSPVYDEFPTSYLKLASLIFIAKLMFPTLEKEYNHLLWLHEKYLRVGPKMLSLPLEYFLINKRTGLGILSNLLS